jgi:hypothetical protein
MTTSYATPPSSLIEIQGSGELDYGADGLVGRRKGRVTAAQLNHAIGYLLGAVLPTSGGYQQVSLPQSWPGIPSLMIDHVKATPHGKSGANTWSDAVLPHQFYMLDVEYKSMSLQSGGGGEDQQEKPENEEYLLQEVGYSCETIIVPLKVTDTDATPATSTKEVKHYIRLPKIEYTATIPKVRRPNFSLIQDLNGKINSKRVFGGAIGTVLFDGPSLSNTISSIGDPSWKFVMKFIYNKHGWNNMLHPVTLKWVAANSIDGGAEKMYQSADLTQLWKKQDL